MGQLSLPILDVQVEEEPLTDDHFVSFGRRLALWVLMSTFAEATGLREGDAEGARVWIDLEGRRWLADLGFEGATSASLETLLSSIDADELARELAREDPFLHCRNCAHFVKGEGTRYICETDQWRRMGLRASYSRATVYYGDRRYYCPSFQGVYLA